MSPASNDSHLSIHQTSRWAIAFLMVVCLSVLQPVSAQQVPSASVFATALDHQAGVYGFPSGDGSIQTPEQMLASVLVDEVSSYNGYLDMLAQSNAETDAWVNRIEQTTNQYYDQKAAAGADAPIDVRAQILSEAIEAGMAEWDTVEPLDPRAQIISEVVDAYGREVDSLVEDARDPRAEAVAEAVDQYQVMEERAPEPRLDPRAEAVSWAVEQYAQSVAQENGGRVRQSVRDAVDEALDQTTVRRRRLIQQRLENLIQWEVPGQVLPTNGRWRIGNSTFDTSGTCIAPGGDNGGADGGTGEQDPGEPLCGYAGMPPFITWAGGDAAYLPGTGSIYSPEAYELYDLLRGNNGETVGSVRSTITTEYRVVSPSLIEVTVVRQEAGGGCTDTWSYTLELVTADESVCVERPYIPGETPIEDPVSTPVASTPEPGSTPIPTTPEPTAGVTGLYLAAPPEIIDPQNCEANMQPDAFDELSIEEQGDGSVVIDYASGSQTLYPTGDGNYQFNNGFNSELQQFISLSLMPDGTGLLSWSVTNREGKSCYTNMDIALPSVGLPVDDEPAPVEAPEEPIDPGSTALPTGEYTMEWQPFSGLECKGDLAERTPSFTAFTLTEVSDGYELSAAGETFLLTNFEGTYIYSVFAADGSSDTLMMYMLDGEVYGAYSIYDASGEFCMVEMNLGS